MSDYGDFCRDQRQSRQRLRMHWHECPTCAVAFGTGTSVAPGRKCRNCGWTAPGEKGDDQRAADDFDKQKEWSKKPRNRGPWGCPYCDMSFGSAKARMAHVTKKHGMQHRQEQRKFLNPAVKPNTNN